MIHVFVSMFFVSLFSLVYSAELLIKKISKFSKKIGIGNFIAGSIILSLVTSLPEIFDVTIANHLGYGGLGLGDIIGSNIANISLVLGAVALISPINIKKRDEKSGVFFLVGLASLFIVTLMDGVIDRIEGILLLSLFLWYKILEIKEVKNIKIQIDKIEYLDFYIGIPILILILIFSSYLLVYSAINMANLLNVPPSIVGLTLLAVGTSLPEFSSDVIAAIKRKKEIAFGDVIGSNMVNIGLAIPIAAILKPITFFPLYFLFPVIIMTIVILTVAITSLLLKKINRLTGMLLIIEYIIYLASIPTFR